MPRRKTPIDSSGTLPDGTKFNGPAEFRTALLNRKVDFVTNLTEKLLTYALGRGIEYYDMPVVRQIVRDAGTTDYRWSALILGDRQEPAVPDAYGRRARGDAGGSGAVAFTSLRRSAVMSLITKKYLPRRTFLRGLGVSVALPLLDGMVPAFAAAAAATPAKRFGAVYVPNGVEMRMWTPKAEGAGFGLSPILEPLAPFRDQTFVLSGLADKVAVPLPGEGIGDHARASSTWLTGVRVKKTEGPDIRAGVSLDQLAAQHLGKETQLASLELALDSVEVLGACDAGYSCAYANTIAWRTPTTPLPMENNPRAVFERLFGASDSTDPATRQARLQQDRSILDFVTDEVKALNRALGAGDQREADGVSGRGAGRRAADPDGGAAEHAGAAGGGAAAGDSGDLRRACAADV